MAEPGAPAGPEPAPAEVPPEQQPDLYGELYYENCLTLPTEAAPAPYRWGEPVWEGFFGRVAEEVVDRFHPRTVLDAGCAIGFLVKALRDCGVEAEGLDSSAWAISQVPEEARPYCRVGSVTDELLRDYDLITCVEVLGHVSPKQAAAAVANLCRHGRAVLFSSTPEHVEEATHINVRPPDYWAALFAGHGFYRDTDFDASFVAPHAVLFHPVQHWEQVVRGYERRIWESQQELRGLRAHRDHLSTELQRLLADDDRAQPQLLALMNTKTFRLTAGIRSLWSRTGGNRAAPHKSLPAQMDEPPTYQDWVREFDTLGGEDRRRLREMISELAWRPTFSVLMPVFNPTERHLRGAIESVLSQMYPDWELCIADDASTAVHVRPVLEEYRQRDHRIQVTFRPTNGHIVEASNSALALARGEFVTLVDHDDEIPAHALACLALELARHPTAALLYSDEDKLDEQGRRYLPYFKPGLNPELFLGQNYFSHLGTYRRDLVLAAGGFRPGFEGSQDYDLALRVSERIEPDQIRHIPLVLYHWRAHPGSTASSPQVKPYARSVSVRAVAEHLARSGLVGDVSAVLGGGVNWVRWPLPTPAPKVCIIAAGNDQEHAHALRSLWFLTDYPNYHVERSAGRWPFFTPEDGSGAKAGIGPDPTQFGGEASDHQPEVIGPRADTDMICALGVGVEAIDEHWLREMVAQLARPGVGLVGARLERSDGITTMGPLVMASDGTVLAPLDGLDRLDAGYFGRPWLVQSVAALSPGCLLIRRSVLKEVGGSDPNLDDLWRVVDLSLRVREKGYRVVWAPSARLGVAPGWDGAAGPRQVPAQLLQRFAGLLSQDPAYSPNLSMAEGRAFTPAWPPRQRPPWAPGEPEPS